MKLLIVPRRALFVEALWLLLFVYGDRNSSSDRPGDFFQTWGVYSG